jgi:hypothetical protein
MINNLFIAGRDYGYGYDAYYIARRDESISFPSNSAIVRSLNQNASDYTVKTVPMNVSKKVKGTLKSYALTPSGYLIKVAEHLISTHVKANEVSIGDDVYTYTMLSLNQGESIIPTIVPGTLTGTIYNNDDIAIQTFTVSLESSTLSLVDIGSPEIKVNSGSYVNNTLSLSWSDSTTNSYVIVTYKYENPDAVSVTTSNLPVFNYRKPVVNENHINDPLESMITTFTLENNPIINGSVSGVIYAGDRVVQTFTIEMDSTSLNLKNINITGGTYVDSGTLDFLTGELSLTWHETSEGDTSVDISYLYGYDFVSITGMSTIDTKYIKIMSTLKCKHQNSYTNVSSKLFYTRCRSFQTLCSSTSSGYVPAITICSENLF